MYNKMNPDSKTWAVPPIPVIVSKLKRFGYGEIENLAGNDNLAFGKDDKVIIIPVNLSAFQWNRLSSKLAKYEGLSVESIKLQMLDEK